MFIKYGLTAYKIRCACGSVYSTSFEEIKQGLGPQGYNKYLRHFLPIFMREGAEVANRNHFVEAYDTFKVPNAKREKASPIEKMVMKMIREGLSADQIVTRLTR
jgi:hypothetical protein